MNTGWWGYLERVMKAHDWSQADLATETGLDPSLISNWKNKGAQPRVEALRAISHAAGVPMLHLLVAAGHITQEEANLTDVDLSHATAPIDVIAAIKADEQLLPEAKMHLTSQYGLLLRITGGRPSADAGRPVGTDGPGLRAVARKGTPRTKRDADDGGSA